MEDYRTSIVNSETVARYLYDYLRTCRYQRNKINKLMGELDTLDSRVLAVEDKLNTLNTKLDSVLLEQRRLELLLVRILRQLSGIENTSYEQSKAVLKNGSLSKYTKEEFLSAWNKTHDVKVLALSLGVLIPTIYNYKRLWVK